MARFFGKIGYGNSIENPEDSGIWVDAITEFEYYGDIVRNNRKLNPGENLNSNVAVGNSISIVADQYAIDNFFSIRYVEWAGVFWTVTDVEVQSPRLILSIGDVYNGPFSEEV